MLLRHTVRPVLENLKKDFPLDNLDKYRVVEKPVYTTKEARTRNKRLAHVIIIFVEEVSALDPGVLVNLEEQQECITKLTAEFGTMCTIPPDLSGETVKIPKLKTCFEESELEEFNRALNLLKHFSLAESVRVELVYVPMWMRDPSKTQPKIQTPEADKHKSLVEIPIKLELKKKSGPAEDQAKVQDCNGYLGEGGINTDDFKKLAAIRCVEHNLQLSSVSMTVPPANPNDEEAAPKRFDLFTCDWELLRAYLSNFGNGKVKKVTSTITVDVRLR
ncbi:hypothetical protein KC332_g6708 [Hortaea werneckii]|nr:hypothetical protein KC358_g6388 [Hortaea werneckii]KAI6838524.1 hypothetical protein KC350_g5820 [Hortaea werneckii]KAI6933274.1 hypothetical protein KC348_g6798 [Hortaea werneckii]KAI6936456.1 hypothetical protein KC341_g6212 [Hortaea werneckii]KAI6963788.1 hypothetical protein KC321_g11031 [Hortaea werneckii]